MPIYTFYNKKSKKEFTDMMSIDEMEKYMGKNKHIRQVPAVLNIVASVGERTGKNDQGWKETLSKIGEAHPGSALAAQTTKKSIKQIRTEQAVANNKKRVKAIRGKRNG
tara:strand:+ start:236 stop:562 length:327 start_codon:yes stop_codon:yes gene_type:complete